MTDNLRGALHVTSLNNSRRNAEANYIFPKEPALREKWIEHIKRENCTLMSHRVCLAHFEGGKKSYMNSVLTVFADCSFELLL